MMLSIDHRWGRRKVTDAPVRFIAMPGILGVGRVTNVSVTGAFMETEADLGLGTVLHVESIEPAGDARRKRLTANVVRCEAHGVGLEWRECASNSLLYAQFGSAYRDRIEFSRPATAPHLCYYQFEFKD
jgi:hypothetical protein